MSLSFNVSKYDATLYAQNAFGAKQLYSNIATVTDKNTQFSDGLAAGAGIISGYIRISQPMNCCSFVVS